jgi:hypothetical protein
MNRIGNNNGFYKGKILQMSRSVAIPFESDTLSGKNSGDRIVAKFENCFGIGENLIVDLVNREQLHWDGIDTFRPFENFISP